MMPKTKKSLDVVPRKQTQLEMWGEALMRELGLPEAFREYLFWPGRRFRFDFAWPQVKVAVELEGGVFSRGKSGHTMGHHYHNNCTKYNQALMFGWRVIRLTAKHLEDIEYLREVFGWIRAELMNSKKGDKKE